MSLNVLNKTFLSVLRKLSVDIDQFPDKSFDGLFESKHNDLNYFLEWFVDNITSENVLTEAELDIYDACKNGAWATDEELDVIIKKCTPSYDELELLDENYVNLLWSELKELTTECQQLQNVGLDLETKENELKKKPNHLKEDCNKWRKQLNQAKEEVQIINSGFSSIEKDISLFKLHYPDDSESIQKFKSLVSEEDELVQMFKTKHINESFLSLLERDNFDELSKLKSDFKTSRFLFIISKSLCEEVQCKISKAEEFLSRLKDESESNFTFDDTLNIFCGSNEVDCCSYLKSEVDLLTNNISKSTQRECELLWHNFLSQSLNYNSDENERRISEFTEYLKHIKSDMASDILIQKLINKSIESEKEIADLVDKFCFLMNENKNKIKNHIDNLNWKNKRSSEYHKQFNEKHALMALYKKMNSLNATKSDEKVMTLSKPSENVKLLFNDPFFYLESFYTKLDQAISSTISVISQGPTSQIQMAPIAYHLGYNKCEKFLSECSHLIQRLLTEYVNVKESVSSKERRKLVLWIDFLTNRRAPADGLEKLHDETNWNSTLSSVKL